MNTERKIRVRSVTDCILVPTSQTSPIRVCWALKEGFQLKGTFWAPEEDFVLGVGDSSNIRRRQPERQEQIQLEAEWKSSVRKCWTKSRAYLQPPKSRFLPILNSRGAGWGRCVSCEVSRSSRQRDIKLGFQVCRIGPILANAGVLRSGSWRKRKMSESHAMQAAMHEGDEAPHWHMHHGWKYWKLDGKDWEDWMPVRV